MTCRVFIGEDDMERAWCDGIVQRLRMEWGVSGRSNVLCDPFVHRLLRVLECNVA